MVERFWRWLKSSPEPQARPRTIYLAGLAMYKKYLNGQITLDEWRNWKGPNVRVVYDEPVPDPVDSDKQE